MKGSCVITYPRWVDSRIDFDVRRHSDEEKMGVVLEAACQQAMAHTGGPFTAAVFEAQSGRLVSVGMNLVEVTKNPFLHGPIVALAKACEALDIIDLGAEDGPGYELFTICQPCGMCTEAILISGIRRLVYGASEKMVEAELDMERGNPDLQRLRQAGVEIKGNVRASEGRKALHDYGVGCGHNYNPRRTGG